MGFLCVLLLLLLLVGSVLFVPVLFIYLSIYLFINSEVSSAVLNRTLHGFFGLCFHQRTDCTGASQWPTFSTSVLNPH